MRSRVRACVGALGHPITISETTRRRLGPEFEVEDLGPHPLKNVVEPIRVYLVLSERAAEESQAEDAAPAPAPLPDGWYRAAGVVREAGTGRALAGLQIRVWDKDTFVDDDLGTATTDAQGRFEVRFTADAFHNTFDPAPDLCVQILDGAGQELHSTHGDVRWNADRDSWFELEVPEERLAGGG